MKNFLENIGRGLAKTLVFAEFTGKYHYNKAQKEGNLVKVPGIKNAFLVIDENLKSCFLIKKRALFGERIKFHSCAKMSISTFNDIYAHHIRSELSKDTAQWKDRLCVDNAARMIDRAENEQGRQELEDYGETWKAALPEHAAKKIQELDARTYGTIKQVYGRIQERQHFIQLIDMLMSPNAPLKTRPERPLLDVDLDHDPSVDPVSALVNASISAAAKEKFIPGATPVPQRSGTMQAATDFMMRPDHNNN